MNNLYQWHNEAMVDLKMQEVRKEIDSIHLLHDAERSNPGLLEQVAVTTGKLLMNLGRRIHDAHIKPHRAYQITSGK